MRKTPIVIAVIAATVALIWSLQAADPSGQALHGTSVPAVSGDVTTSPISTAASGSTSSVQAAARGSEAGVTVGAGNLSGKAIADLGLTRQLAGDHVLTMEGRQHRVLGSKEVVDRAGKSQTMLVIRDELSGQISYRLSGLQFSLKDGVDYEAFIREHRSMQRLFVNPVYAQVGVDAAEIAALYMALSQDGRVAKLRFMTREPVVSARS